MPELLQGIGVSAGWAAGPVSRVEAPPVMPAAQPVSNVDAELDRAQAALNTVVADLRGRAEHARNPTAAEVLHAQVMMIDDQVLRDRVALGVQHDGLDAPHAIDAALAEFRAAFEAAGGYLAERAADLDDLRDRAVAACLGRAMPGIPAPGHPFVLVAADLAPADTAELDPAQVLAIVTEAGGPTSHTAILARALGIPAVVSCAGASRLDDGTLVALDGTHGAVHVGITADEVSEIRVREAERRRRLSMSTGPGRTADDQPIALLANVGSAADATEGAEGIGLFRTELLYLDRTGEPALAEQVDAYAAVFAAMPGRKVVVRTLDAGADKPLPFLSTMDEPNPALGVRGLRIARRRPDVLRTQVQAIAAAAEQTDAEVWVMAPMVATVAEAAEFVAVCRTAGLRHAGVMIEIPSAALRAEAILGVADFISIGTNDLSQYAFAADRQCGDLADLLDPWQPALLELIAACGRAGAATGKPVGVCGEAAADPNLAVILAGLGITSLSMSARSIAAVRDSLKQYTLAECGQLAAQALAAPDAASARALVART
jgi:phosphotransferase system enzyme I (PtsI)